MCKTEKTLADFYKWNKTKDGLMSRCKTCHCAKQKQHRDNPETEYNKQSRLRRLVRKQKAIEMFGNKCADCHKMFHPNVYDFHHLDPKLKDLTLGELLHKSWKHIEPELQKCIMLCANCHRLRHVNDDTTRRESEGETTTASSS